MLFLVILLFGLAGCSGDPYWPRRVRLLWKRNSTFELAAAGLDEPPSTNVYDDVSDNGYSIDSAGSEFSHTFALPRCKQILAALG